MEEASDILIRSGLACTTDPRPETARLRARVGEIDKKADELLEMMTPATRPLKGGDRHWREGRSGYELARAF